MDKDKDFIIPKHVLELYSQVHERKPFPSIWDFGFVDKSIFESVKIKPYYEQVDTTGKQKEIYLHTPEYDIYLINLIDTFEMYFLYDSELKDSALIAASKLKKYKVKFED